MIDSPWLPDWIPPYVTIAVQGGNGHTVTLNTIDVLAAVEKIVEQIKRGES